MKKFVALLAVAAVLFGAYGMYRVSDFYHESLYISEPVKIAEDENSVSAKAFNNFENEYADAISAIKNGFEKQKNFINLRSYKLTVDEVAQVYLYTVANCGCFYIDNNYTYYESNGYVTSVNPQYTMDAVEIEKYTAQIDTAIEGVAQKASAFNTAIEKLIYIHDYLIDSIEYDSDDKENENNVYGALVLGKTKCRGYAEAFRYIAEKIGIRTYLVFCNSLNHVWNMVDVGGKYYFVDCTWDDPVVKEKSLFDDPLSGIGSYKYFMCSETYFLKNEHNAEDWIVNGEPVAGEAIHTEYDDFFWRNCESLMRYANNCWFYDYSYSSDNVEKHDDVVFSIDRVLFTGNAQFEKKIVRTINSYWGTGLKFYASFNSTLQSMGEFIYYFKADGIYRLEDKGRFNGKGDTKVFENPTDKNIYDFTIDTASGTFTVVYGAGSDNTKENASFVTYNIADYFG